MIIHVFPPCLQPHLFQQFHFVSLEHHPLNIPIPAGTLLLWGEPVHPQGCAEVLLTQHSKLAEPPGMLTSPKELWHQSTLRLEQAEGSPSRQPVGTGVGVNQGTQDVGSSSRGCRMSQQSWLDTACAWQGLVPGCHSSRSRGSDTHTHHRDCFTYSVHTCK